MNQKGFSLFLIILGSTLVIAIVAGIYYFSISQRSKAVVNQPSSPKPGNNQKQNSDSKPDLIIEKITYKKPKPQEGSYGMPVETIPGNYWDFTITVKNIGNADFAGSFYVFNSRSERDFLSNVHSHGELVNQKEEKIPENGSLDVTISDLLDDDTKNVQFLVNYKGQADKKDVPMAIKDESNYENNSYKLTIN